MLLNDVFANFLIFLILPCTIINRGNAVLDHNDEDFFGKVADEYDWSKHPCRRNCNGSEAAKICEYVFVVEQFSTMSKACFDCPVKAADCYRAHCLPGDGTQKTIYTANRLMPGPQIEVCLHDVVSVEVRNNMLSESTTIHWHGILQSGTQYMDGVPFVTQCPILPGEKFRYTFNVTFSGTYFWHSHIGNQRSDGLHGPLIVRSSPNKNLHHKRYDHDNHTMIIVDWKTIGGTDGFVKGLYEKSAVAPETILINGLGQHKTFERQSERPYENYNIPSSVFIVSAHKRYRFRLINAGSENCPIIMSIDNHKMHVISLDASDIEPVEVDAITTWPGERVDFIIEANQQSDNYWIRYRGYSQCKKSNATGVYQVAILRYSSASPRDPRSPIGYDVPNYPNDTRVLNPFNTDKETSRLVNISIPLLNALTTNDPSLTKPADQQVYISFDLFLLDNYDYHRKQLYSYNNVAPSYRRGTLQLNHISFKTPDVPLLSQWEMIGHTAFCNSSYIANNFNCTVEQCACTHVIELNLNSIVEIFFIDQGSVGVINHPLHLHGHFFRVVSEENLDGIVTIDRVKQLDKEGKIKRRLDRAPLKDTIKVPGGGYTIIRLHAKNPGFWYFHCHFEEHSNAGMALVFKVGDSKDWPKVPQGFPKCGAFLPNNIMN